ncbi:MAG: hypothetical protein GX201_11430 [Clostridiales bacterium]|jgi:menaquinone-dependent protoporphyrinogen IX oxidase|nr:hypothetical protein [Clostridiales bacterium]
MKKVAVVFKSKYGSTEKYAKWIAEDTCAEIFKVSEIKADKLEEFDTIVYCGGLYAGGILGFSFIKNNYYKFCDKKLIVVAVGATLKKDEELDDDTKGMIATYGQVADFTNKNAITPIINAINN